MAVFDPTTVADTMQQWLEAGAADGFNVMFPTVPGGVEDFVNLVVPELQRRGLFRKDYTGTTLRENGLEIRDVRAFAIADLPAMLSMGMTDALNDALAGGADEVGFQLDGRETLGALRQVGDGRVAAAGVGQSNDAGGMQEAVRGVVLAGDGHPAFQHALANFEDFQTEQIRQGAGLDRHQGGGRDVGAQVAHRCRAGW